MEFNEKLQELRKQRGLTQEELAQSLYVSRTAISKWESGRGYPNIDSLKGLSKFFSVTIDELLSGEEVLSIAEEDSKEKERHFCNMLFGLLDLGCAILFFIPLFGQEKNGVINAVSLISLTGTELYLKLIYFAIIIAIILSGVCNLVLQNCKWKFFEKNKNNISLIFNAVGVLLFIISPQPYAAALLFVFLIIKGFMLIKKR